MAALQDIVFLSLFSFLGNVGVAVTGFGMAIVYLFGWQVAVLAGYESNFKYAVFIQALALCSAQPLLIHKAQIQRYASRTMLLYFIPVTIVSTPLGQITSEIVSTHFVEAIGGFLVTFVALFEIYKKRDIFHTWFCGHCKSMTKVPPVTETSTHDIKDLSLECKAEDSVNSAPHGCQTLMQTFGDSVDYSARLVRPVLSEEIPHDNLFKPVLISKMSFSTFYTCDTTLGEGAFSVVKSGTHKHSGEPVAIKVVTKSKLLEEEDARLKQEIAILQGLAHPNIIRLYDVFDEPNHYFVVTEKMAGGDLLDYLATAPSFNEYQGRQICKGVLEALYFMHSRRVVHRDLKPENFLLDSHKPNVIKVADFGFAKRGDSFITMCGTPAYVAPEILEAKPYGVQVDMWSIGVVIYMLLGGYQPFRGEDEDALRREIKDCKFEFDEQFWASVSNEAKGLISSLLTVDPKKRLSAKDALAHPWFSKDLSMVANIENDTFAIFMIGSQRSGSNWLRTMLDEREDLACPHPPHMMRDFIPIIEKFGDLTVEDNFRILVDHLCTFVERNQVPWTDKHGSNIHFPRASIYATSVASCKRILKARTIRGDNHPLENALYLLSIFDAIMNFYTKVNAKRIWMCKSMGMSKFHDFLLEFYSDKRLRYIYLVRDPRDVAMSFMKTPVGDCHYHPIVSKWTNLQQHALRILAECPGLTYKIHYESILRDKESLVKGVYQFIGDRRFGGIKRQASVLYMEPSENLINNAKSGRESEKASKLSYQFKNLVRGESFAAEQIAKWRDPDTGLNEREIQLIESVAWQMMEKLGYNTHLVGVTTSPTIFSKADLSYFAELNKQGIQEMLDVLKDENPGDFERRKQQSEVLAFSAKLLEDWDDNNNKLADSNPFLSNADLKERLEVEPEQTMQLPNGGCFRWATASQRGYYPDEHDKPNQDATKVHVNTNEGDIHWFSVFDGHGPDGHRCSTFASEQIPMLFADAMATNQNIEMALEQSHLKAHELLVAHTDINESLSGTTATTLLLSGGKCIISNVGDSTCILGSCMADGSMAAKHLCTDHTPLREDERKRIQRGGGLIMTVEQHDAHRLDLGVFPNVTDEKLPPRIWSQDGTFPGCAFTRSIGDSIAHSLGVIAQPETFEHTIRKDDKVLVVLSDGITEFMDEDTCIEIACRLQDPSKAAEALVHESSQRWLEQGDYMDDMTAIVIFLDHEVGHRNPEGSKDVAPAASLGPAAQFWTLFAGAASGYLGGLCGIRGPPIILYFLHPPTPLSFTKESQLATGACITATNVAMRVIYYLINTLAFGGEGFFEAADWGLYLSVVVSSMLGVLVGANLFKRMKGSKDTIRGILSIFLLLCGFSLLASSFMGA